MGDHLHKEPSMAEIINNPVEYAREVVGKDPMATYLGISVEEARAGYARTSLTIRPEYLNAADRAHGIAVHAVADQAFAVASNSTGVKALALNFSISYIAGAQDGEKIVAEAMPINVGKKVGLWRIEVRGSEHRLIATCEGIAYHK
jgi:acyl-CoA thioesterase